MIGIPGNVRIYLACGVTDMRRGFDSLAAQVQTIRKTSVTVADLCRKHDVSPLDAFIKSPSTVIAQAQPPKRRNMPWRRTTRCGRMCSAQPQLTDAAFHAGEFGISGASSS